VNPNWLIVVEGVESGPSGNYWWGGNLSAAGQHPVRLTVANRLVYSPHDYPSTVFPQRYFSDPSYPANLPAIWDANWGYLYKQNVAPILLGEFGTKYETASDKVWLSALVNYLGATKPAGQDQGPSWTYWSWNPNSGDTGGILADDWNTVRTDKTAAIRAIQSGTLPTATGGGQATVQMVFTVKLSAASPTPVTVKYATANGTATAGQDYLAATGALTFAAGQTEQTVAVTVLSDAVVEGDEFFTLALTDPTGATLGVMSAKGTIRA
jgi:endoglucanase